MPKTPPPAIRPGVPRPAALPASGSAATAPDVRTGGDPDRSSRVLFTGLLRQALCRNDVEVSGCRTLSAGAYHLTLPAGGPASVVIKRLDPAVAHRDRLLVWRWLPAVGLAAAGPPLLATVCDHASSATWSVYAGLDDGERYPVRPGPEDIGRLIDVVASMHVRFASHPLMAEVRHHGEHLGPSAYVGRLNDALLALAAAEGEPGVRAHRAGRLLTDLARAVGGAEREASALLTLLTRVGGPDTLLHGDLWPQNVMTGRGWLRLIDWDRLGVGPAIYDLSTLLLRVLPAYRRPILDQYLAYVATEGWPLPTIEEVEFLSAALERTRLATLISWRVLDLLREPRGSVATWALGELRSIRTWWQKVGLRLAEGKAQIK